MIHGRRVRLRPATVADGAALVAIRETREVRARWLGDDLLAEFHGDLADDDLELLVIEHDGGIVGAIQWSAVDDPQYRHAGMDLYLHPDVHGQGLGPDAIRALVRHLVDVHGHRRFVIDPAADNRAAIRCYEKVGFRAVGVMRGYERGPDGTWHDGLLMDLLADELVDP